MTVPAPLPAATDTLFSAFLSALRAAGRRRPILEDPRGGVQTYHTLLKTALALGRIAVRLAPAEARIGVLMPNLGVTLALVLGMGAFRRVPAMLNHTAGVQGLRDACVAAEIRVVITSRTFVEVARLDDVVAALGHVRWVYLEDLRTQFSLWDKLWLMAYAVWFPRAAVPAQDAERPAVVLFTSGSEGRPKGVVLSHRALLANVGQISAVLDLRADDKFFTVLPMFHAFGLTAGAILPLVRAVPVYLYLSPLHYREIPALIRAQRATLLFATGTFLAHYARQAQPEDFRTLRYVVAGAEKLSDEVRRIWQDKFGIHLFEGYGATECAPVIASNHPRADRPGTVGRPLPGIECRIEPVAWIEHGGLLHVRGPNLMSGYLRCERPGVLEPPASTFGPGWYNTGDIVEIDADGFIRIVGRLKRFAKIAGEMVPLDLCEQLARAASPAHQHGAVARPDAERGEAIVLFTTDAALGRDDLLQQARAKGVAERALPKRIVVLDALPLLGSGKTDYAALTRLAAAA